MLNEKYKKFLPDTYSDEDKEKIIKDLHILSKIIIDNDNLLKMVNQRKL